MQKYYLDLSKLLINLSMNPQQAQIKFQEELAEFQASTAFPAHFIPTDFSYRVKQALKYHSPSQLKLSINEFADLYNKSEHFSLLDMGTLLHVMESKTMEQLAHDLDEYVQYQVEVTAMAIEWKRLVEPKVQALQRKYQTMQNLSGSMPKGKVMQLGKA